MPDRVQLGGISLRTVLVFLLLLGLFNGLYQIEKRTSGRILDIPYTRLVTASAAVAGAWLLPMPVDRRGDITLASGSTAVVVCAGCNGLETLILMLAGVLALPSPWSRRLRGLALYLPLLFILNVFRVLMLLFMMAQYPTHIDLFHYQIGQGIMVVFVMVFWMHYVHQAAS